MATCNAHGDTNGADQQPVVVVDVGGNSEEDEEDDDVAVDEQNFNSCCTRSDTYNTSLISNAHVV